MKLGIPRREEARFSKTHVDKQRRSKYKSGKQEDLMAPQEFYDKISKIDTLTIHHRRQRVFLLIMFYTGLRQGEIRMLRKSDFIFGEKSITIKAFRKKKGFWDREKLTDDQKKKVIFNVPIRRDWPYVDEIVEWVNKFEGDDLILDVKSTTAWQYVKDIFPDKYPHFFRLNRLSTFANQPGMTFAKLRLWSGLHLQTIEKAYMSSDPHLLEEMADTMVFEDKGRDYPPAKA